MIKRQNEELHDLNRTLEIKVEQKNSELLPRLKIEIQLRKGPDYFEWHG